MNPIEKDRIRRAVRSRYAGLAAEAGQDAIIGCRLCQAAAGRDSRQIGYSDAELEKTPREADMGLGCGNPQTLAALKPGETVVDLGSGAGIDAFLAADRVGPGGRVIGVDMTPEMIERARKNAETAGVKNVEFRQATIEALPVADASVDVIISNCVVNLSADKPAAFAEAYRVLKPGGRLAIADIVALQPLPEAVRNDLQMVSSCIGGAETVDRLTDMLTESGFESVSVRVQRKSAAFIRNWLPESGLETRVASADVTAVKPVSDRRQK